MTNFAKVSVFQIFGLSCWNSTHNGVWNTQSKPSTCWGLILPWRKVGII